MEFIKGSILISKNNKSGGMHSIACGSYFVEINVKGKHLNKKYRRRTAYCSQSEEALHMFKMNEYRTSRGKYIKESEEFRRGYAFTALTVPESRLKVSAPSRSDLGWSDTCNSEGI